MCKPSVLAVIPARGGSKGIPRKNLQLLGGIPLVEWAIRVATRASGVTRIVVSTEDVEIAAVSRRAGAEVLPRPDAFAQDDTPSLTVLQHSIDEMKKQGFLPDAVVLLEPTSPFRTATHVNACIENALLDGVRTCITVVQLERNPYNIFSVSGEQTERFIRVPDGSFSRRQEFPHLKRLNGCIYAMRPENIRDGRLVQEPLRVVEMRDEESINIDTPLDLEIARLLVQQGAIRIP